MIYVCLIKNKQAHVHIHTHFVEGLSTSRIIRSARILLFCFIIKFNERRLTNQDVLTSSRTINFYTNNEFIVTEIQTRFDDVFLEI